MHAGTDNYTYLTTAPIRRVIPTMAIPTIISMLVTALLFSYFAPPKTDFMVS